MKFAWLCSHESYQPEVLVEQAVAAEDAGFDVVLGSDHFHPWVDDTSAAGFVWSWLGTVAARTDRVQLGTCVTCPLFHYHPGLVAQMTATADRLSGGRMLLGLGTGEAINERSLGFPFPGYGERHARMEEALEIIRRLLDGEKLSYNGSYYQTETARLYSPPLHPVPMLMAAGGPKSATLAGQRADGIITSVKKPEDTISKVIEPYRRAAEQRGGSQLVLATRWTVLGQDNDEAWLALSSMRVARSRSVEVADPAELRARADTMDPSGCWAATIVHDAAGLDRRVSAACDRRRADIVSIQVASADPVRHPPDRPGGPAQAPGRCP
jgi:coenzyme F420-dependent glucose-6-phosphate dehydrogenase